MLKLRERILPILQLTRMALVFTAIADSCCAWMLMAPARHIRSIRGLLSIVPLDQAAAIAAMSIGLYGFGTSLNDIIDRRRDAQIASDRPLPSGRIGVRTAHAICIFLALLALGGAAYYAARGPAGPLSLLLAAFTLTLIVFYNLVGKYLVVPGLLTLGLIRFFHAAIPSPPLPVLWQPLLLLNHITIISALSYAWENKRPRMRRKHFTLVIAGLCAIDGTLIGLVAGQRNLREHSLKAVAEALAIQPGILLPLAAVIAFVPVAMLIYRKSPTPRAAGQNLTLVGVLWLIVYDACFAAGYVSTLPALLILSLLPISCLAMLVARWWTQLRALSQRPAFRRVEI